VAGSRVRCKCKQGVIGGHVDDACKLANIWYHPHNNAHTTAGHQTHQPSHPPTCSDVGHYEAGIVHRHACDIAAQAQRCIATSRVNHAALLVNGQGTWQLAGLTQGDSHLMG
jgi:hypothetical protein